MADAKTVTTALNKLGTARTCPTVLLLNTYDQVLMGLRHYNTERIVWTIPGGRCEVGESVGETLNREVAEETGITEFSITQYIGSITGANPLDQVPTFIARTNQVPKLTEPEKFSEWRWFDVFAWPDNFINPPQQDFLQVELQTHIRDVDSHCEH